MTNEEKSREIANDNCTHANCSHGEHYFTSELDCYKAAMEMAEWKDDQMKKLRNCANCKYSMCAGDKSFCDDGVNMRLTDYWECCDNWDMLIEERQEDEDKCCSNCINYEVLNTEIYALCCKHGHTFEKDEVDTMGTCCVEWEGGEK